MLFSSTCRTLAAALVAAPLWTGVRAEGCHPEVDASKAQYVVGYGSLMQAASKRTTEPGAGENLPIRVRGFRRGWNTHGVYPTTYLGVQHDEDASMVAALYRSFLDDGKLSADAREIDYCRAKVEPASVEMLDGSSVPSSGQIWIYVSRPESLAPPDAEYPIVQSYVDIFISGCLELQVRVADPDLDFVEQCIRTTQGWSRYWVNDRIHPRRPFPFQPKAFEIDKRLGKWLPEIYADIRIEGPAECRAAGNGGMRWERARGE
jgi:hypothetical protein